MTEKEKIHKLLGHLHEVKRTSLKALQSNNEFSWVTKQHIYYLRNNSYVKTVDIASDNIGLEIKPQGSMAYEDGQYLQKNTGPTFSLQGNQGNIVGNVFAIGDGNKAFADNASVGNQTTAEKSKENHKPWYMNPWVYYPCCLIIVAVIFYLVKYYTGISLSK